LLFEFEAILKGIIIDDHPGISRIAVASWNNKHHQHCLLPKTNYELSSRRRSSHYCHYYCVKIKFKVMAVGMTLHGCTTHY
jgi:hypothetical protein